MVRYRIQNDDLKGGGGMAELNEKQQRFVEEYMIDLNATQAAIRAGYSVKSASDIGGQLLGKTHVQRAIARAKAERSRRTGITQDRVLQELARIAFVNAADALPHAAPFRHAASLPRRDGRPQSSFSCFLRSQCGQSSMSCTIRSLFHFPCRRRQE